MLPANHIFCNKNLLFKYNTLISKNRRNPNTMEEIQRTSMDNAWHHGLLQFYKHQQVYESVSLAKFF